MIYPHYELATHGYTWDGMIGVSFKLAKFIQRKFDIEIYWLDFDNDTESAVDTSMILDNDQSDAVYGIESTTLKLHTLLANLTPDELDKALSPDDTFGDF